MASRHTALVLCLLVALHGACAKTLERCEFARWIWLFVPADQIATWVCIADAESGLQLDLTTNTTTDGTISHGIFQINDGLWCSRKRCRYCSPPLIYDPEWHKGCDMSCEQLTDDEIGDDVECSRRIYAEVEATRGDGYLAWPSYDKLRKCRTPAQTEPFVRGCGL